VSQVLNLLLTKNAFSALGKEFVVPQNPQYLLNMITMFYWCLAIYQDIIKKDKYKLSVKWLQQLIHQCLEGCWSISEVEWHNNVFKMTLVSTKSSFSNILKMHPNLMIV
jgi:hypothetical protein